MAAPDFPYWKNCLPTFGEMFAALRDEKPRIRIADRTPPCKALSSGAGGVPGMVLLRSYPEDHRRVDGISNHFTEEARVQASFAGHPCPLDQYIQWWEESTTAERKKYLAMVPEDRREFVYSLGRECNAFSPSLALLIYRHFGARGRRILDLSAGWGDRAIAAAAAGAAEYHGIDPNARLAPHYKALQEACASSEGTGTKIRFTHAPAEDWIEVGGANSLPTYQVTLLSPPYGDLEIYVDRASDLAKTQASTRYPTQTDAQYCKWKNQFLAVYLEKAFTHVQVGGWVVMYVEDVRIGGKVRPIRKDTCEIMEKLEALPGPCFGLEVQSAQMGSKGPKTRWALSWFRPIPPSNLLQTRLDLKPGSEVSLVVGRLAELIAPRRNVASGHMGPDGSDQTKSLMLVRDDCLPLGTVSYMTVLIDTGSSRFRMVCDLGTAYGTALAYHAARAKRSCTVIYNVGKIPIEEAAMDPWVCQTRSLGARVRFQRDDSPITFPNWEKATIIPSNLVSEITLPTMVAILRRLYPDLAEPSPEKLKHSIWLPEGGALFGRALAVAFPSYAIVVVAEHDTPTASSGDGPENLGYQVAGRSAVKVGLEEEGAYPPQIRGSLAKMWAWTCSKSGDVVWLTDGLSRI